MIATYPDLRQKSEFGLFGYKNVAYWGPGWVREEPKIKSVISGLKLALSA